MAKMDEVEPNLFICDYVKASNVECLTKYNIKHILSVWERPYLPVIGRKIQYYTFYVQDDKNQDISFLFGETFKIISNALKKNEAIIVHCNAGISRSSTIVIAYLMKKYSLTLKQAYEKLLTKHCEAEPNANFIKQLKSYETLCINK